MKASTGNLYRFLCDHAAEVKAEVNSYLIHGYTQQGAGHCAACTAHRIFKLSDKQWNGPAGAEYFAAALAYIIHFELFPNTKG